MQPAPPRASCAIFCVLLLSSWKRSLAPICTTDLFVVVGGGMAWLTRRAGAAGQHVCPEERLFPARRPRARNHLLGHVARGERFLGCSRAPAQSAASASGRGRGRGSGCQRSGRLGRELGAKQHFGFAKQHFCLAPPALQRPPSASACARRGCGGIERQRPPPRAQRQHGQLRPQRVQQYCRRAPRWQHARQRRVPGPECLAWASACDSAVSRLCTCAAGFRLLCCWRQTGSLFHASR